MLLIPAIDIKEGKCVRLRQGLMEDSTVFSDSPLAMAEKWVELGAKRLHLVDLDGAFAGEPANAEVINAIAEKYPEVIQHLKSYINSYKKELAEDIKNRNAK